MIGALLSLSDLGLPAREFGFGFMFGDFALGAGLVLLRFAFALEAVIAGYGARSFNASGSCHAAVAEANRRGNTVTGGLEPGSSPSSGSISARNNLTRSAASHLRISKTMMMITMMVPIPMYIEPPRPSYRRRTPSLGI